MVKIIRAFLEDHTHVVARSHLKFNSWGSASSSNLHTGWYLKALRLFEASSPCGTLERRSVS